MPELTSSDLHNILNNLFPLVEKASQKILEIYNEPFEVVIKDDNSPVTKADQTSNRTLINGIKALTPLIPIISEESKSMSYEERKSFTYCWIIDPLDGTKEFIKKNDEFSINVALCHHQEIILGIVMSPVSNEIAWAIKNQGAFIKKNDGQVQKLKCGPHNFDQKNLRIVTSRSHISDKTRSFIENFEDPILIPKGSSWKFILIASNEADYYPRPGTTMEWDTAAPQIILEEAGGSVLNLQDKSKLKYNKSDLRNPEFLAKGISHESS